MDSEICPLCGKPIPEDSDFVDDEFLGLVHGECYDEALRNDGSDDYDDTAFWHDISHER